MMPKSATATDVSNAEPRSAPANAAARDEPSVRAFGVRTKPGREPNAAPSAAHRSFSLIASPEPEDPEDVGVAHLGRRAEGDADLQEPIEEEQERGRRDERERRQRSDREVHPRPRGDDDAGEGERHRHQEQPVDREHRGLSVKSSRCRWLMWVGFSFSEFIRSICQPPFAHRRCCERVAAIVVGASPQPRVRSM